MNKTFENKIREALNKEPSHEPFPGHEERFETRLFLRHKKSGSWQKWYYLVPAAAIITGLIVTLVVTELGKNDEQVLAVSLSDVSYEMAQIEMFYTTRISQEMPVITSEDPVLIRFSEDIDKLESEYETLKLALARDYSNTKVTDAMISNYKYRIRIIQMMQKYIDYKNNKQPDETQFAS